MKSGLKRTLFIVLVLAVFTVSITGGCAKKTAGRNGENYDQGDGCYYDSQACCDHRSQNNRSSIDRCLF